MTSILSSGDAAGDTAFDADIAASPASTCASSAGSAARTLALYRAGARATASSAAADGGRAALTSQPHHVRRWAAQLHAQGLGARSIAIVLSAWRGLYRWLGREGSVALNPVDGVRAPKAPKPLPKALSVDQAVALAEHRDAGAGGDAALAARDHASSSCCTAAACASASWSALDCGASAQARGWIDAGDRRAHVLGKGSKRRSVPVGAGRRCARCAWLRAARHAGARRRSGAVRQPARHAAHARARCARA